MSPLRLTGGSERVIGGEGDLWRKWEEKRTGGKLLRKEEVLRLREKYHEYILWCKIYMEYNDTSQE